MVLRRFADIVESPLEPCEIPEPQAFEGQIRVRVKTCGICHTDLHTIEGEIEGVQLPTIPGHQVVGIVDQVGEGVTRFKKGDRVGVAWLYSACGECKYCRRGNENLCESALFTGHSVAGGYAGYIVVPADFAYRVPQGFSDVEAAPLLCAGIIGYRALRLSGAVEGSRLGLFGFGASAHITIQVALHRGCEVYVFTRNKEHQALAEKLGAAWVGEAGNRPPKKLDNAIIFSPAGEHVLQALEVLDKGGVVALAGIHMSPIPEINYNRLLYHERVVRSVANATRRDGEEFLAVASEIPIKPETEVFKLEEANKALQKLKERRVRGAGVLVI